MRTPIFRAITFSLAITTIGFQAFAQSKPFDASRMDTSVSPCTDFFSYVNGTWLKTTQIPSTEIRWGTFNMLGETNNALLREILETSAKSRSKVGTDAQLIGDFYSACMDEASIEKAGLKPIEPFFRQIASINDPASLQREIANLHDVGLSAVFNFGAGADLKDTNAVIINAFQGGLSLPNRDYYLNTDAKSVETRAKFVDYIATMFKLLGDSPEAATRNAATVMEMQTRLAKASLSQVELRNPDNRYNKITLAAAQSMTPDFSWSAYLEERGVPAQPEMNIAPPKFFTEVNSMIKGVSIDDWKTYLRFMVANAAAPMLAKRFAEANFDFFSRYLGGQKEQQPRWRTCVQQTNGALGEALGMEYAKRAFKPEAKARMNQLIDNLMLAMRDRLNGLEWMSDETKKQALAKLATFKRKIGYPDVLRGYKGLTVDDKSYAGNLIRSNQFQVRRNFQDLGKPRDKTRMNMTPPTVNASYSSQNNDITFPAGILQPPFFNFDADDALNYGAIGGVIGHEITHGFDDQGSRFDADGNLKMWWTPDDRKKFEERAACVIKQFDSYEVQPGLFINGRLTLGENIGDFAGLTVSHRAYELSRQGKPEPAPIDGFTDEQRFFLGWAQVWADKYTPEAERLQVATNVHSLPKWRVNGPLSNMPQFAAAFNCKSGDPMVRGEAACAIW
jgi:predicted metalloendopeptidase